MTMSEVQSPIWARLKERRFDVMFVVGLAMAAISILAIFILVSRESCEEERIVGLAYYTLLWSGMAMMFGLQAPVVAMVALLAVGARQSRIGIRFCIAVSLALGALTLALPEVVSGGTTDNPVCSIVDAKLPWSLGVGFAWLLLGLFLMLMRRVPAARWIGTGRWASRAAASSVWVLVAIVLLPTTDAFTYDGPQRLNPWLEKTSWWIHHNIWVMRVPAVDLGLLVSALMLTLLGIRRGWIGLTGLRLAFLLLGAAHLTVIVINLARMAIQGSLVEFLIYPRYLFSFGLALVWSSLWLGLGIAFCLIRREWWERVPTPHPPGSTLRATI
jgi:hypothetical protein